MEMGSARRPLWLFAVRRPAGPPAALSRFLLAEGLAKLADPAKVNLVENPQELRDAQQTAQREKKGRSAAVASRLLAVPFTVLSALELHKTPLQYIMGVATYSNVTALRLLSGDFCVTCSAVPFCIAGHIAAHLACL